MRFDNLVQRASDRLARDTSRREFFRAVATPAAAIGVTSTLAACGSSSSEARSTTERATSRGRTNADMRADRMKREGFRLIKNSRAPDGAVGQDAVAVCYTPVQVTATEPRVRKRGLTGVAVRKAPHADAELVLDSFGNEVFVPQGKHFSRQSDREAPNCGIPPTREAVDGFIWGYPGSDVRSNKSGWIPVELDDERYIRNAPGFRGPDRHDGYLCGPAGKDFDCRSTKSQASCNHDDCGGPPLGEVFCRSKPMPRTVRKAVSRRASNLEDYYLRLSFNSTAFGWVAPRDKVLELCRRSAPSYGRCCVDWSFVEVVEGGSLPAGTRGWMLETGLARPGRNPLSRSGPPPRD